MEKNKICLDSSIGKHVKIPETLVNDLESQTDRQELKKMLTRVLGDSITRLLPISINVRESLQDDFTITDFVSDMRASTPSVAAELCVPDDKDTLQSIANKLADLNELTR